MRSQYRKRIQKKTIIKKRNPVKRYTYADSKFKELEFNKEISDYNNCAA